VAVERFVERAVMEEWRVVPVSALNTTEEGLKIESHGCPLIFHR
jgi:hypothetical protein